MKKLRQITVLDFVPGRYTSDLGSLRNNSGFHEVLVGDHLADNQWHQVEVRRAGMMVEVMVDRKKKTVKAPGKYSKLDIDNKIYVAGIDTVGETSALRKKRHIKFEPFEGCLEDVTFNDVNILQLTYEKNSSTMAYGNVAYTCTEESSYNPVTFPTPHAYVMVIAPERNTTDYGFKFRTYDGKGLLLFQNLDKPDGAQISIALESGRVRLDVNFNNPSQLVTLHAGKELDDGLWHFVSVSIHLDMVRLTVDDEKSLNQIVSVKSFSSGAEVMVGASRGETLGFVGCMYDLVIQGTRVNFTQVVRSQVLLDKCYLTDHCLPSPCKNRGRCTQLLNQTKCDCKETDYKGKICEVPAFNMENCADWWATGKRRDQQYKINPGNMKAFWIYCNMSSEAGPETVVLNLWKSIAIKASNAEISRSFYKHHVRYEIDKAQMEALTKSSTHCRQYIRYNCFNSVVVDSPRKFDLYGGRGARWVSPDGHMQDYWGGARRGSHSCACGMDRSCAQRNRSCNCDIADSTWRSDGGYLRDKSTLPVQYVLFSVDGTSRESFFTLGNLECFGSTSVKPSQIPRVRNNTTTVTASPHVGAPSSPEITASKSTTTDTTSGRIPSTTPQGSTTTPDGAGVNEGAVEEGSTFRVTTGTASQTNTESPVDKDLGPVVIIETPRKYITIRETGHQLLVMIVLSIVLVLFIIAIVVLLIKQNLLFPCKCLQMPIYEGVRHVDNIELGPSSALYGQPTEPDVPQYETSPYQPKDYNDIIVVRSGSSLTGSNPEMDSEVETDRLDISNGSSCNSEVSTSFHEDDAELEKRGVDHSVLEVAACLAPKALDMDTPIVKKAILDVISLASATSKEPDINKEIKSERRNHRKSTPEGYHQKLKFNDVPSKLRSHGDKKKRHMSLSDDEYIETSTSDQNNSSDMQSWSDGTLGGSENDEDSTSEAIYKPAPSRSRLPLNGEIPRQRAYVASDMYLSLEQDDQFNEASDQSREGDKQLTNNANESPARGVEFAHKGKRPARNHTKKRKYKTRDTDRGYAPCNSDEPEETLSSTLSNGYISRKIPRNHEKTRHLNSSDESGNTLGKHYSEQSPVTMDKAIGPRRPNGRKGNVVVTAFRDHGNSRIEILSDDDVPSETAVVNNRYETEL